MLVLKNISKSFGKIVALDNVGFVLKKGEVATLLGPNGAGKTTLMRIISSIVNPDAGSVEIFGFDNVNQRESAIKEIGYMPENNPVYDDLSVFEFLFFMAKIKKVATAEVQKVVDMMSLNDVYNQKIATLSKGYKSRTAIAATMLGKPKILILDEPTEGLDPNQKQALRDVLKSYAKENIVLISTHIIEEAEELNSRILVLKKGKLVENATLFEIKDKNKGQTLGEILRKLMGETL